MKPLFLAVLKGPPAVKRALREAPQSVAVRATRDELVTAIPHHIHVGDTALHLAAAAGDAEVVELLLAAGTDVEVGNRRGATALHYACDARPRLQRPDAATAKVIRRLVAAGAPIDQGDRGGVTPWHRAVRARNVAAVRELLAAGARVDVRLRIPGSTPLHLAVSFSGAGGTAGAMREQREIVSLLLRHGADPKLRDAKAQSAAARASDLVADLLALS